MLWTRPAARPFRAGQTNAGRGPGGERVLFRWDLGPAPHCGSWITGSGLGSKNIRVFTAAAQPNKSLPARQPHGVCSRDGRRAALTPARPGRDLPGRCGSRPVPGGYTRKAQPSRLRVCGRAWGAPLTCKHTRGKGDPQHRRPDGHFFGHAEERHSGAGSERHGSSEQPGPVTRRAERSGAERCDPPAPGGRGRAARGGGTAALGVALVALTVPAPRRARCRARLGWREDGSPAGGVPLPLGDILGCGV